MCSGGGGGVGGAVRKGPWTEQEDAQLAWFVRLLGERRWDFLAQVSGLRRTGKSCRLRWVNYLHPGLKRGRITADEERLILQLHAQWGSRWSRIARRLPGRTDNEIKNYWRTHMRKKAQEEKARKKITAAAAAAASSSSSLTTTSCSPSASASASASASLNDGAATVTTSSSSASASASAATNDEAPRESSCCKDEEADEEATTAASHCFTMEMDQLWTEIAAAESYPDMISWPGSSCQVIVAAAEPPPSPAWELCADYSLWTIDDEEYYNKIL